MKLNLEAPFNSVSLGQISYGVTNELFKKNVDLNIFPVMGNADLGAYDKNSDYFNPRFSAAANKAIHEYDNNIPSLKIWHINQSWAKLSKKNYILTFHELDSVTQVEKNILKSFDGIFVTSNFTKRVFEENGINNVVFTPMGIDSTQNYPLNKEFFNDGSCVWSIIGKVENLRKNTKNAIQGWCKKFGNNSFHRLHLFVNNPFFKPEQMNAVFGEIFNGAPPPFNVKIFPHQPLNSQMNDAFNCTDIVIDLSRAEALSLPSLNCVALGKHALIHHNTAFLDWATKDNATLIEPTGMVPAHDGIFFHSGQPFNQGNFFDCNLEEYDKKLDEVYVKWKSNKVNEEGKKLNDVYSYSNGVDIILKTIFNN